MADALDNPITARPGPAAWLGRVGVAPAAIDLAAARRQHTARAGWARQRIDAVAAQASRRLPTITPGGAGPLPLAAQPVAQTGVIESKASSPGGPTVFATARPTPGSTTTASVGSVSSPMSAAGAATLAGRALITRPATGEGPHSGPYGIPLQRPHSRPSPSRALGRVRCSDHPALGPRLAARAEGLPRSAAPAARSSVLAPGRANRIPARHTTSSLPPPASVAGTRMPATAIKTLASDLMLARAPAARAPADGAGPSERTPTRGSPSMSPSVRHAVGWAEERGPTLRLARAPAESARPSAPPSGTAGPSATGGATNTASAPRQAPSAGSISITQPLHPAITTVKADLTLARTAIPGQRRLAAARFLSASSDAGSPPDHSGHPFAQPALRLLAIRGPATIQPQLEPAGRSLAVTTAPEPQRASPAMIWQAPPPAGTLAQTPAPSGAALRQASGPMLARSAEPDRNSGASATEVGPDTGAAPTAAPINDTPAARGPDPDDLAEQVIGIVMRRLEVERERRGGGHPWR